MAHKSITSMQFRNRNRVKLDRRRTRRGDRRTRLSIERLEERSLLTIVFPLQSGLETHSTNIGAGTGLQDPQVNLIFAGDWTKWQQSEGAMQAAVQSIVNGPYLSGLAQYTASGTANMGEVWSDPSNALPGPQFATAGDLQTYLQNSIATYGIQTRLQSDAIYAVVLDPLDTNYEPNAASTAGAFNDPGSYNGNSIQMLEIGTAGATSSTINIDRFTLFFSHELAERDVNNHILLHSPFDNTDGNQVADGEQNLNFYSYRLNGAKVQAYWSDLDKAAIVPNVPYGSSVANFVLAPTFSQNPNAPGFLNEFDLTVNSGLQPVTFTPVTGGGVAVAYNGQTATFAAGDDAINSITVSGTTKLEVNDSNDASGSNLSVGDLAAQPGWGYVGGMYPVNITFPYASTGIVEIDPSSVVGGNTVNVLETGSATWVNCGSTVSTAVDVGDNSVGVQAIRDVVQIYAGTQSFSPNVTVNVNDSTDPNAQTAFIENESSSPGWGDVRGLAPANIDFQYGSASLTIDTSAASGNAVNVLETGVPTSIDGQSGATSTVRIGDTSGIQNILGQLTITGPTNLLGPNPAAAIIIDDTNDQHARTFDVENSFINAADGRIANLAPTNIDFQYWNASSLTIDTSSVSGNVINVLDTGTTTNLNTFGGYTATVNIGGTNGVQGILGDLHIGSNPAYLGVPVPNTTVNVDDTGDGSARNISLRDLSSGPVGPFDVGSIGGLAPGHIDYEYGITSSLTIDTDASFGNSIVVNAMTVPTSLVGGGITFVDLVYPAGPVGTLSLSGTLNVSSSESGTPDSGQMYITVDDSADANARVATVTTFIPTEHRGNVFFPDTPWGSLSGLGPGTINYEYADTNMVLIQGNAADQIVNPGSTPVYLNQAPVITSISPSSGPEMGGEPITIFGDELGTVNGVRFGNGPFEALTSQPLFAFGFWTLTANVPSSTVAGTVDVTVRTSSGGVSEPTSADDFTYIGAPTVTSLSPVRVRS